MIVELPFVDDEHEEYYMFVPMLSTLYGREEYPHRFLRVVPGDTVHNIFTTQDVAGDNSTMIYIETVDMGTFLQWVSYGHSPFTECAMSGLPNGIDFSKYSDYLLSQATLRHYEARCRALYEICLSKKLSFMSRLTSDPPTSELIDELEGALCMWEMLMNTGQVRPKDCLSFAPLQKKSMTIPYAHFEARLETLGERMSEHNFANLKYKITSEKRKRLLSSFS